MTKIVRAIMNRKPLEGPSMSPEAQFDRLSARLRQELTTSQQETSPQADRRSATTPRRPAAARLVHR